MYTEINPLDKIEDAKELLNNQNIEVKTPEDNGYDWLEENAVCLIVSNPQNESSLEIVFEENNEFSLFFADYHCHYFAYEEEFKAMCKDLTGILKNSICAAAISYGDDKFLGSTLLNKEAIDSPYHENFEFVLKYAEFADKIKRYGGHIRYSFWDSTMDMIINL